MAWHEERFTAGLGIGRVEVRCSVCSRSMWLPPSKTSMYLTCGGECRARRSRQGAESRRRDCKTCGASFMPRGAQVTRGVGVFCSQRCNTTARAALNRPEAQARARAAWRETYRLRPFAKSGQENPRWNGGPKAAIRRRIESGLARECCHRRRAKMGDRLTKDVIPRIGGLQRWKCAICKVSIRARYHIDHITPIARGGRHVAPNIQLLCPPCNWSKHARDPVDYMQSRGFLL